MTKYIYFILFSLSLSLNLFSQETNIETEFSQDGALHGSVNDLSQSLVEFKNHEKCVVIDYLGKDKYKIKYKGLEGFVDSQYLVVTEDMMDLFYAYQEKQRKEVLKQEENRRRNIQEILRKKEEEKREKQRQDSIAKVKESKKKEQALLEQARREKMLQDSISRIRESEKKQQELEELARRNQEHLKETRRKDSIAKVIKEQKRQQELKEILRRKEEEKREKERQDSIAKVKEAKKKEQALQEKARREKILQDSIAKAKENQKKELLRKNQESINRKKHEDFIAKVLEEKKTKEVESNTLRETCNYSMNEFDDIDNVKIIRTIPYKVNDNLTIELYRQGHREYVFFNLEQDLGCVSYLSNNRSYVRVTLENNQVVTFYHSWDVDCGNFKLKGRLSSSRIAILKKSPIKSLKFKGTKYSFEIDSVNYKNFFIDKLQCLD